MAARRDEPTRVAPHGAPGTRAICDSSIVPLGLRGPFLNALRVDQSDLKQALILGRPRDPCKNTRGAHLMLTRATLARLTAPRTLSLRDPRECGDLALDRRGPRRPLAARRGRGAAGRGAAAAPARRLGRDGEHHARGAVRQPAHARRPGAARTRRASRGGRAPARTRSAARRCAPSSSASASAGRGWVNNSQTRTYPRGRPASKFRLHHRRSQRPNIWRSGHTEKSWS